MKSHSVNQGFSLLEVLVAFVILSISIGALLRAFSGGLGNVSASERYGQAVLLAESKMAAVGIEQPLEPGLTSGKTPYGLDWSISVQPYLEGDLLSAIGGNRLNLYRVDVKVAFNSGKKADRDIHITTLKLPE